MFIFLSIPTFDLQCRKLALLLVLLLKYKIKFTVFVTGIDFFLKLLARENSHKPQRFSITSLKLPFSERHNKSCN